MKPTAAAAAAPQLLGDIRQLIEQSRGQLATAVNSALTMLYWHIGQRIRSEVLQGQRATYGEQMVAALAKQLEADYGRGFSAKNLRHMLRFAEVIPSEEIVSAVRRQLSWCSGKKQEQIKLLELNTSGMHIAKSLTTWPPKHVQQAKRQETIARSRARLQNRGEDA